MSKSSEGLTESTQCQGCIKDQPNQLAHCDKLTGCLAYQRHRPDIGASQGMVAKSSNTVLKAPDADVKCQSDVLYNTVDNIIQTLQNMTLRTETPTPIRRGRPPTLKCRGYKIGDKRIPCPDDLKYSDKTADLFINGSKSWCRECRAKYSHNYFQEHKEHYREINNKAVKRYNEKKKALTVHPTGIHREEETVYVV